MVLGSSYRLPLDPGKALHVGTAVTPRSQRPLAHCAGETNGERMACATYAILRDRKILRSRTALVMLTVVPSTRTNGEVDSIVLRVWEAVSTEPTLGDTLAVAAKLISTFVPFDSVGIVALESGRYRFFADYRAGRSTEGQSAQDQAVLDMMGGERRTQVQTRPLAPYPPDVWELVRSGGLPQDLYGCPDLLKKETWYEHEVNLAGSGTRAYRAIPLFVRGDLIGLAVFNRRDPIEFAWDQAEILNGIAPPIGVALANALANERIRELHDQLEAENLAFREQTGRKVFEEIVGWSAALHRVLNAIDQVGPTDTTVLLTGETGTGKELIAQAIHKRSLRRHGPLVSVHCASVPQPLLASELFGHERGAFTGASERRKGRFEQAHGGTLFLDEVGELPGDMQVMLLRVLQERVFERLGGSQSIRADVRVIAATNRELDEEVQSGRFRNDLFYRLNVFPIRLPPLRERSEDIPHLVAHLAAKHSGRVGKTINRIDPRTMNLLVSHHWPGNVRELENVVERAVILSTNGVLKLDRGSWPTTPLSGNLHVELRQHERETIEAALTASTGKVAGPNGAAARLGMPPSTLEFRIKRLGIDKMRFWQRRRD